jgi:hypothetical protein
MAFVQYLLADERIPLKDRQDALHRAFADPGIPAPVRESTPSYWFKDPHPQLANIQSPELPQEADIVIIGSGITGTSVARTLLEASDRSTIVNPKRPAVVMLEARDTCTGATGRNGGHILETVEEFAEWADAYGLEAAKAVAQFRLAHLEEILEVANEYGLTEEVQARKVQFLSVYFDDERWREAVHSIQQFKECMPDESAEWKLIDKDEIPKVSSTFMRHTNHSFTRHMSRHFPSLMPEAWLQDQLGPSGRTNWLPEYCHNCERNTRIAFESKPTHR